MQKCQQTGISGGESGYSQSSQESLLLTTLLKADYSKAIDSFRVQRLMGILPGSKMGKATMENIPSTKDRSMFSCERYQFFLDAPFEIGQQCCGVMKKKPAHEYARRTRRMPILATMASESRLRTQQWLRNGCNGFNLKQPVSTPMAFWTESDVLTYIYANKQQMIHWRNDEFHNHYGCYPEESEKPFSITSPLASIYGDVVTEDEESGQMNFNDLMGTEIFDLGRPNCHTTGCSRSGCITCLFGYHHESTKETSRIQNIIDFSNPKIADWMLRGGHFRESDGMWEPYQGLGYAFIFEWCNARGGMNYWYPNREKYLSQLPDECWSYIER